MGTGLSTGSGLRVLAGTARTVVVWGRTEDRAQSCLSRLGMTGHSAVRAYDPARLAGELRAGDVVVSMLPATEHPVLLRLCTERNAHVACSSYASIARILDGDAPAGLRLAAQDGQDARRWLDFLGAHGVRWRYDESPAPAQAPNRGT
ncbi:saccharopine dehydrogenase NADP-binding domain-containing protein [Streptomyces sp. TE33382]